MGERIRVAKAAGANKDSLGPLLADLLAAKAAYKAATGEDYGPPPQSSRGSKKAKAATAPEPMPIAATSVGAGANPAAGGGGGGEDGKVSKSEQKRLAKAALKADKKSGAPCDADLAQPASAAAAAAATAPAAPAAVAPAAPAAAEELVVDFDEYRQVYQYSNMALALARAPPPPAAPAAPAGLLAAVAIKKGRPIAFQGGLVPYLTAVFLAGIRAAFPALDYQTKSQSIVTR
jgi:hypothetical protein